MIRRNQEPGAIGAYIFVLAVRGLDQLGASVVGAFTDDLQPGSQAASRQLLDALVDLPEQRLILARLGLRRGTLNSRHRTPSLSGRIASFLIRRGVHLAESIGLRDPASGAGLPSRTRGRRGLRDAWRSS